MVTAARLIAANNGAALVDLLMKLAGSPESGVVEPLRSVEILEIIDNRAVIWLPVPEMLLCLQPYGDVDRLGTAIPQAH